MMELKGKTLVFTDCHLGLKNSSVSRLNIAVKVFKELLLAIKKESISNIIFCGDAFHDRRAIDVNVLNIGYRLFSALAKYTKVYLIVGNHDCHFKSQTDVNSVNIFADNPNIVVVSAAEEVSINGQKALFVPWLADLEKYEKNSFDLMFGHFDINDKYLIASYIEDNSKNVSASENLAMQITSDELLCDKFNENTDLTEEINTVQSTQRKSNELIGDFIEIVRQGGVIYSGHIHLHKEFVSKGRQFVFVGAPYQQNFGEMNSEDGYYILDEHNCRTFVPITSVPSYKKIIMSEIVKVGLDNYDFSFVKGNIVKKVYDTEVDKMLETKINQRINDFSPYEETIPDFEVKFSGNTDSEVNNETLELIQKSKLDYIFNYIESIDSKSLEETKIEKGKLFEMMKFYYEKAEEGTK